MKLVKNQEVEIYQSREDWAYAILEPIEVKKKFTLTIPKIDIDTWQSIKKFLYWTQVQYQCESVVVLYYHPERKHWRYTALPQYITKNGLDKLTISEVKESDDVPAHQKPSVYKAEFMKAGYIEYGTVHHHCTIAAGQSGTDAQDESQKPGIHITIGNLDAAVFSFHARFSIPGSQFIELSMEECLAADELKENISNALLTLGVLPNETTLSSLMQSTLLGKPLLTTEEKTSFLEWFEPRIAVKKSYTPSYGYNSISKNSYNQYFDKNHNLRKKSTIYQEDSPYDNYIAEEIENEYIELDLEADAIISLIGLPDEIKKTTIDFIKDIKSTKNILTNKKLSSGDTEQTTEHITNKVVSYVAYLQSEKTRSIAFGYHRELEELEYLANTFLENIFFLTK